MDCWVPLFCRSAGCRLQGASVYLVDATCSSVRLDLLGSFAVGRVRLLYHDRWPEKYWGSHVSQCPLIVYGVFEWDTNVSQILLETYARLPSEGASCQEHFSSHKRISPCNTWKLWVNSFALGTSKNWESSGVAWHRNFLCSLTRMRG